MLTTIRQTAHLLGRENRRRWVLLVLLALLVSGVEMVGAVLVYSLLALVVDPSGQIDLPVLGDLRQLFDGVDERSLLLGVVVAMGIFFLLRGLVRVGVTYVQARVAHNAGARLSNRLVEGYLRWPYAAHLRRPSSELIRNGHQAVLDLISQVVLPVIKVVAETVLVVGMLIVLVAIAPLATALAVVVIGGAATLLLRIVQPRLKRVGRYHHDAAKTTLGSLQEALHGVRDIKVLGRERYFARRYGRSRITMARARYLQATAAQLPTIVIETSLLGFILLFFGIVLVHGGQAQETLSTLGLFGYVGLRLQPSLQQIISGLNNLKYSAASLDDLDADLRAVERNDGGIDAVDPLPFEDRLELRDVGFRYEGAESDALLGVSLTIRRGEQIGICGPTGGGKSTLVDLVCGLLSPTTGAIEVDGVPLATNERAWHRNLGVVPQMVFLTDDTLRRNIALGVPDDEIDERALDDAVGLAQLDDVLPTLQDGLNTVVGERGVRLSGGQRQRVAIARALYHRPSVLVFDEGTSALDNTTEANLMRAIERLRDEHTIILVAHRLSTVRNSDRVLLVESGRIAGSGTYDDLLVESARFRQMTEMGA